MYTNPNFYNGIPQGTGYQFSNPQINPFKSSLTEEEIKELTSKVNQFSLVLSSTESAKARCNHYYPNGTSAVEPVTDPKDGSIIGHKCQICGETFDSDSWMLVPVEKVQEAVDAIISAAQTVKMIYPGCPQEIINYFSIIPMIGKLPHIYSMAVDAWNKYGLGNPNNQYTYDNRSAQVNDLFNSITSYLSGAPLQPQPVYNAQQMYQQPMMQQPMGQPMMQQPVMSNGMGFMPQPGYMPQTSGYQYNPMGQPMMQQPVPVAQEVPQAAAPADETTKSETLKA